MTLAGRRPEGFQALLTDSANVLEGAFLVQSSTNDDRVMLPTGADFVGAPAGLAWKAGPTSAGRSIDVVTEGVYPGIAGGTIAKGDKLVVAGATGTVKASGVAILGRAYVGFAMAAAVSGDRVEINVKMGREEQ
jgi:hypothetical protein